MQCVSLTAASVLPSLRCLEITQQGGNDFNNMAALMDCKN